MDPQVLGIAGFGALAIAFFTLWTLLKSGLAWKIIDLPNERSLHERPTPRIGGLCVMLAMGCCVAITGPQAAWPVLGMAGFLTAVSLLDDIFNLPAPPRLLVHLLTSAIALYLYPTASALLLVLVFLSIVWMTNLYNFMDGLDGFSGGMTIFGFGTYALAAYQAGDVTIATISIALVGATLGFLFFNLPPARVFMGDAGAIPIGFLAALLGYLGARNGIWKVWFPILVFSPFIYDATWTIVRRLVAGEQVWKAHRSHLYQRMAQSHLGHSRTLIQWYFLMALACTTAYVFRDKGIAVVAVLLACWLIAYVTVALWISRTYPIPETG